MLTRAQQILLKRAQRGTGLDDAEYRDALELVSGCRSSTDPRMTDRHLDVALAYMEAIFFRRKDAGALQPPGSGAAVFRQRGYWAAKNPRGQTSRDRFTGRNLDREIAGLEIELSRLGFGEAYCLGIRDKVTHGRRDAHALHLYRAALSRTVSAKQKATA
jgi:hypothetical protein